MAKKIDPLSGLLATLKTGGVSPTRGGALTFKVGAITVDTCVAFDTGKWETGIDRGKGWVVVEQYDTEDEAKAGHTRWINAITAKPDMPLRDLDLWGIGVTGDDK